jgi:molecular chaperone DnaK
VPQVEVTFDIDANGILDVTAHDKATGREQKITITASSGLSKDEIDRMVREAEQHAQEDQRRKEEIEVRNRADSLAYQAERTLKDVGEKITVGLRSEIEEKIKAVRDAISAQNVASMQSSMSELEQAMQRIGQEIYGQPGATAGSGEQPSQPSSGENTGSGYVEGEYREV